MMPPKGGLMKSILTEYVYPPIPDRRWDWVAYREGYEPGDLAGQGPTEAAAILDLLEQEDALYD